MGVINGEKSEELRKSAVMTPSLVLDYENWLATLGILFAVAFDRTWDLTFII